MDILPLGGFGPQEIAQGSTVLGRRCLPVFLDGIPAFAETLFISVSILGDDRADAFGLRQRQPQPHRCAIIEDIDCKALQTDCLREISDDSGQVLKRVAKAFAVGSIRETKTGKVGRDNMVAIGEGRNQVAKHVGRGWETVQKKNGWSIWSPRFTIENLVAVNDGMFVTDHLCLLLRFGSQA